MSHQRSDIPILLVDDEQDIRDVLQMALVDAGYGVLLAENGEEAWRVFQDKRPALVVTDIKMPVMDGIELLRRIKREMPETEVIMITGHGDMDLAIKSLKHEATDFVTKPINVEALEIALKRARDRIQGRETLRAYTTQLEALLQEKSELQDHLAKLGLMIGSISHGIKGLLTGLDGGLYMLSGGLERQDPGKTTEGLQAVKQMAARIRKMILDILFYAKKRELQWDTVEVTAFAEEVGRTMAAKLSGQPIEFVCRVDAGAGACALDSSYVTAALMNLFDNAVDACQRDAGKSRHQIAFEVKGDGGGVRFSVTDNGTGMDETTRAKLFTLFFSSKGRQGTGLGLYIAQQIVQQHGGVIAVSSAPGRGSKFSFRLPRLAHVPPGTPQTPEAEGVAPRAT